MNLGFHIKWGLPKGETGLARDYQPHFHPSQWGWTFSLTIPAVISLDH